MRGSRGCHSISLPGITQPESRYRRWLTYFPAPRLIPGNLLPVLATEPRYVASPAAYNEIADRLAQLAGTAQQEKSR